MNKLVFDIGAHTGEDTKFYLARGFRVVALEANPVLAEQLKSEFQDEIKDDRLVVENKAFWDVDKSTMDFYIVNDNNEFSSLDRDAIKAFDDIKTIKVATTNLEALIKKHGVPHYIKCDIESADHLLAKQLTRIEETPDFVSVEGGALTWLADLSSAGYDRFQLINQGMVRRGLWPPKLSSRYGEIEYRFGGACSGPFGYDLNRDHWLDFEDTAFLWLSYRSLRRQNLDFVLDNWFDFHATTQEALEASVEAASTPKKTTRKNPGAKKAAAKKPTAKKPARKKAASTGRSRTTASKAATSNKPAVSAKASTRKKTAAKRKPAARKSTSAKK